MKFRLMFLGMILIALPGLYFLDYMGLMDFDWRYFLIFWPMLFVFWGISMLPFKHNLRLMLLSITMVLCGFFIYFIMLSNPTYFKDTYQAMVENKFVKIFMENLPQKEDYIDSEELMEEDLIEEDSIIDDTQGDSLSVEENF
jgi:hypothetical protein